MLRRVVQNCDAVPERITADSGYFSADAIRFAEHIGTERFISVGKHRNDGAPTDELPLPQHQTAARVQMRAILETERGRQTYARRKATVEPVFGQIELRDDSGSSRSVVSSRTDANGCWSAPRTTSSSSGGRLVDSGPLQ